MPFPDSFVDEVRRTADIVRYVSEHVQLKKMGTSYKGLCPFHQEKTPSFNVNPDRGAFHCFGCGVGGDVFKFAMLHEKVSFPESIELVARRFGIPVPENRYEQGPDRKERDEMLTLLDAAAEHFERNLWSAPGTRAREYLLGRGFKKETLERIRTGAAADSWGDLFETLKGRFPVAALMTAGLVREGQKSSRPYDWFRNRAVFPILNDSGRIVGFGARALDGGEPKYLNSPESPVYQKSKTLYGLSWAKEAIRREGRVVLMEGYLDVARALENGVSEVVATCGTALTAAHARLIRRFTEKVIVNFDQDDAGQNAARKSLDLLLEEGLKVHVVELPTGDDPDTFLKAHGGDAYRQRLEAAPPAMQWLIHRAAAENDTKSPAGKGAYLNALLPVLARIDNAVERMAWLPAIVERGALDEGATREELRRALSARATAVKTRVAADGPATPPPAPQDRRLLPAEKLLLTLIVEGSDALPAALLELQEPDLEKLRSAAILRTARAHAAGGKTVTRASLEDELGEDDRRLLNEIAVGAVISGGVAPGDCVRELRCGPLKARMAEIQKDLARATGADQEALLNEKLQITRLITTL
ncbi:MAG TPA: DNA primase [Vicinamibacteria bacterium]|nr:DNA primase [Vicinamibacteria bacterium]